MPIRPVADIAYKTGDKLGEYEAQRCKLDLYLPRGGKNFATLVWLHGGALKAGAKDGAETPKIARALADDGIAVASVNYRLSPKATYPAYVEDSAAAVAWVRAHIADEAAPVLHCRKNTPPMLVLSGDHDMAARSEENEYLVAVLKGAGNKRVTFRQIPDRTHGSIANNIVNPGDPVSKAILDFIAAPVAAR